MFSNFKITAKMGTPIVMIDDIILDSLILCSVVKEQIGDERFNGDNIYPSEGLLDEWMGDILDKKDGVYCTSIGFGEYRESVGSWVKRFDTNNDDIIKFPEKVKKRIDIGSGSTKNYHMPIVLRSYNEMYFYVRGDKKKIQKYLSEVNYIGKKRSQGYGEVVRWTCEDIPEDWSHIKDSSVMRPLPARMFTTSMIEKCSFREFSRIPPYWRTDSIENCIMPGSILRR